MKQILYIVFILWLGSVCAQNQTEVIFRLKTPDNFTLETFKFYVGVAEDSTKVPEYHLIDLIDGDSSFMVKKGRSFYLLYGTDSLSNVSGAFEGALDPINGMYWTWNTGFINLKIEGNSSSRNKIEWHIGGYRQPWTTSKWIKYAAEQLQEKKLVIEIDVNRLLDQSEVYGTTAMRPTQEAHEIFQSFIACLSVK